MASDIDICNLALSHIGDPADISAIEPPDGSVQAEHCARFYPIARDQLLASHPWGFATKRIVGAVLSTSELPASWGYAYAFPNPCLAVTDVFLPDATDDLAPQNFIGETLQDGTRVIFTNAGNAVLRYVVPITDTTKFSALFITAFARLLASYLAGPIIKGKEGRAEAKAQRLLFEQLEFPRAATGDHLTRRNNQYRDATPAGVAARA